MVVRCLILVVVSGLLGACAALGPSRSMTSSVNPALLDWPEVASSYDEQCFNLHTKYSKWGVFVGCQSVDIFDIRTDNAERWFDANLARQSCMTNLDQDGQRNYIRTGADFLFIDKTRQNANAWFVPAGYYSDGVSSPDILREVLPGAILDTESPRTLSAALFHDRYFCLFEYTRIAWNPDRENFPDRFLKAYRANELDGLYASKANPIVYRRRGCSNVSFRNGLRTAGASSFISTVYRRMVGLVNPGGKGYCPRNVHADALVILDQQLETMLQIAPLGSDNRIMPGPCKAKLPLVLCLADIRALRAVTSVQPSDYGSIDNATLSDEWRQVLTRIMCFELQARDVRDDWYANEPLFTRSEIEDVCAAVAVDELTIFNEDIRSDMAELHALYANPNEPIESPFRAGDFLVEGALMLTQPDGPATFLRTVAGTRSVDFAMLAIVQWNEQNAARFAPVDDKKTRH